MMARWPEASSFDIDWSLLDAEGIVSATNSLGLERLAGISQQYLSMLTASVSYLAHSSLLPDKLREQAESLYSRLRQHVKPGDMPVAEPDRIRDGTKELLHRQERHLQRHAARHGIYGRCGPYTA